MGDRVYADITIHRLDYDQHQEELDKLEYEVELQEQEQHVIFRDYEANYANMDGLEEFLADNKIEHNKSWENGGDFEAGYEHGRRVKGELLIAEITKSDYETLEELKQVLQLNDPEKIKDALEKKVKQLEPFEVTLLKPNIPKSVDYIKKMKEDLDAL